MHQNLYATYVRDLDRVHARSYIMFALIYFMNQIANFLYMLIMQTAPEREIRGKLHKNRP